MKICFNIDLPDDDLQQVGLVTVDSYGRLRGSSRRGSDGRELCRFFPVLLLLESLCQIDQWHLGQADYVPLYESGIYYKTDKPGREDWDDIPTLYRRGWGDCKKLAAARCAEYRQMGVAAVPCISWKVFDVKGRKVTLIHVMVLLPDDTIEDPSKILGMKGDYNDDV